MQHIKASYHLMVLQEVTSKSLFRYICSSVTNNGSSKTTFSTSFRRTGLTLASSTSHGRRGTFSSQLDACARLQSNLSSSSLHRQQLMLKTNKQTKKSPAFFLHLPHLSIGFGYFKICRCFAGRQEKRQLISCRHHEANRLTRKYQL